MLKILNKGTGAGGANTNLNGLAFEKLTNVEEKLLENNFIKKQINKNKFGYYLINENNEKNDKNDKTVIYLIQNGFKTYIKTKFNIDVYRQPDEAYLIKNNKDDSYHLKILEKKNQNVEGSVEDKLKTGSFNRKEYELMFKDANINIKVSYAFCLSKFLETKINSDTPKYKNIKKIILEDDINLFYGETEDYFQKILDWIN